MTTAWIAIYLALAYVGTLFLIASAGDRFMRGRSRNRPRPLVYVLSLGVYCTSWTFFGSVGLSARTGYDFLPVYIGPVLLLILGWPVLRRIVRLSKRLNITSIADFIAARYGKNRTLGAIVALVAIIGVVPYISLQLKAVAFSLQTMMPETAGNGAEAAMAGEQMALLVTIAMAGFAILFGTRHIDATEHQDGLIMAIAVESVVKLVAFLVVGAFVVFGLMGGLGELAARMAESPRLSAVFAQWPDISRWLTITLLSLFAFILLPRQFHVAVVENTHESDVKRAAWSFPLYLVAINLFVVPIAAAGLVLLGPQVDADTYVLALPVSAGATGIAMIAFIGGLSAATAMVIIETVALSIMACNNLVVPYLLARTGASEATFRDMGRALIIIRRTAIAVILLLAYSYYLMAGASEALAQTGLISFAAVAQFAPAFFGGLFWRGATACGAMAGIVIGFFVWAYTLLLPSFADSGWIAASLLADGPFGIAWLNPRALLGLEMNPLSHGVLWSLGLNLAAFVIVSRFTRASPAERLQASLFMASENGSGMPGSGPWPTAVTVGQLQETVARYLGEERTRRSFAEFAARKEMILRPEDAADIRLLRFAEHLLASAVGAASARLVLSLLLERVSPDPRHALQLLDDASAAIQQSRDLLQSAIDHVRQGIGVFDRHHNLICWNRQFRRLLGLPVELEQVDVPLRRILLDVLARAMPDGHVEEEAEWRLKCLVERFEPFQIRFAREGTVLEVRSSRMPDGGVVITFADITERVLAAEALQMANALLERRVEERTAELVRLNEELARAKAVAEQANLDKTRFIAAASHDILQPLNAARLFASALVEKVANGQVTGLDPALVRNIDASLESVEEILSALLDISRLDAGALKPEIASFPIAEILEPLAREFAPAAQRKGLTLKVIPCTAWVRTDRRLLRRLLQNLLSNAIKYTHKGTVLMGCRRSGENMRIEVHDTGPGIPEEKQQLIFREFERLEENADNAPGLGLGLSIVERIARMLELELSLRSRPGHGSVFMVEVPRASAATCRPADHGPRESETAEKPSQAVLVIDNETAILEGMRTLLSGWGCRVFTAKSGAEAARLFREAGDEIGLVIADYHLDDEEEGLNVIETLRALAGRHIPAILITADRSREVQERARRHDVTYLRKPIRPAALRAVMNRICRLSRRRLAAE